jgi:hypothetical protein
LGFSFSSFVSLGSNTGFDVAHRASFDAGPRTQPKQDKLRAFAVSLVKSGLEESASKVDPAAYLPGT